MCIAILIIYVEWYGFFQIETKIYRNKLVFNIYIVSIQIISQNYEKSQNGRFAYILIELTALDQCSQFDEFKLSDRPTQSSAGSVQSYIVRREASKSHYLMIS